MPKKRTWELPTLLVILAVAVLLRALYLQDLKNDPWLAAPALDPQLHDYWAWGLATGDWSLPEGRNDPLIRSTPYFRPPGYPIFLAGVYSVVGRDPVTVRIVQFALGIASGLLAFLFARRWFGPPVAAITAGFMAVYWSFIYFEGDLVDPVLLVFLLIAAVFATALAGEKMSPWCGTVAGALFGLAALVRPNVLVCIPFACSWLAWVGWRGKTSRRWIATAAALAVAAVVAILPATIRNYRVSGELVLISANGGINLLIGNNDRADGINAAVPDITNLTGEGGWTCFDYPQVVEGLSRRVGRPVTYAEASRIWRSEAVDFIVENPGRFLALTAKRAALFWGPGEVGDRDVTLTREASPVLRKIKLSFPLVLAFAITGAVLVLVDARSHAPAGDLPATRLERFEVAVLVLLFIVVYSGSFLPFFFNARYRVPLLPFLGLFGAYALWRIASFALGRDVRRALGWAAATIALFAVTSLNLAGYEPRPGEWHYQMGNAYRDQGKLEEAAGEYREALRLRPGHPVAHNNLGVVLMRQGKLAEAAEQFRRSIAADPRSSDPRFNLANMLVRAGRIDPAIEQYRAGLEANPLDAKMRVAYGSALVMRGKTAQGLEQYQTALELRPDEPMAHLALGRTLLGLGRVPEAVMALERAAQLEPGSAGAHLMLSRALDAAGRPDEAAEHHAEAVRLDPRLSVRPSPDAR